MKLPFYAVMLLLSGCVLGHQSNSISVPAQFQKENDGKRDERAVSEMSKNEIDLTEAVLRFYSRVSGISDDFNYLTKTPMRQWGKSGNWANMPEELHMRISDLPEHYRKASEAIIVNDNVLDGNTKKRGLMTYVTIKKWITSTEAEVEIGFWKGLLGGGYSIYIWRKDNGIWRQDKFISGGDS